MSWRGIFAIPPTPFTDDGALDLPSLERTAIFCLNAGVHGIVGPVIASEAWTLGEDERFLVAETLTKTAAKRVPVVIGISAGSTELSLRLLKHAIAIGADAVIATPPAHPATSMHAIRTFYERISAATSIPVFIQNADPPYGTRMAPEFVAALVRDLPLVDWVKEETLPPGKPISTTIALAGSALHGVMGGMAGRHLFDEVHRGAVGTMPACEVADVHVQVWNALEAGDEATARHLFARLLPILNFEVRSPGVYKAVLKQRGVIESDYMRQFSGNPLDADDRVELDRLLADLSDLLTLAPPHFN